MKVKTREIREPKEAGTALPTSEAEKGIEAGERQR
jgi:hypothetical protein